MSLDLLNSALIDQKLRDACRDLEARLRKGERQVIEQQFAENSIFTSSPDNALELIYCELTTRETLGDRPTADELYERFPQFRGRIQRLLEVHDAISDEDALPTSVHQDTDPGFDRTLQGTLLIEPFGVDAPRRQIGDYELIEELGRGGTGVVYRARQVTLDRLVAVKLINGDQAGREQILRFHAEAEAAAHLQHPNIVQIHEVGTENGYSFLSLELVEGGSLSDQLVKSALAPDDAARLMLSIALAMDYAHTRGVVHRDLKPANILLTPEGEPKVADFGLAKRSWEQERKKTRDGTILGTPGYMAPEQALGDNEAVGPPADVYAMGAILYEMLTGRAPFQAGGLLETLEQVRLLDPVPPRQLRPRLSRDLETICLKCLHKQPESRYRSALELAKDLERYLADEPILARHITFPERCVAWMRRRPAIASLIATVAVVAMAGLAGVLWQWNQAEQRRAAMEIALGEVKQAQAMEAKQRERVNVTSYLQRVAASYGEWLANHPARAEQLLENCDRDLRGWEWHYLDRLIHAEHWTLDGHTLPVKGLAFSPNGHWIVSSSGAWGYNTPGEIIVWDAATGKKLREMSGHAGPIMDVAFSPDGSRIASAGGNWDGRSEVILWETSTGKQLNALSSRAGMLMDVEFSGDGKWLAAAGLGGLAQVWNAETLEQDHLFTGHRGLVFRAAFSPNSKILATCGTDSTVRLWNLNSKELIIPLSPGPNVRTLTFSPDGNRLAAGSWNGIVKVWQLSLDSDELVREIGHQQLDSERVRAMEFSPDSQHLAVACSDGSLRIWHPVNGTEIRHFYAHSGSAINVAFHPRGHRLVTSGIDQKVKYWDLAADPEPKDIFPHDAQISALALSPNGQLMAIAGGENHVNLGQGQKTLNIWSFTKNEVIHRLAGHKGWLTSVAFSPNGDMVLSGSEDKSAILWDVASGKVLQRFEGHRGTVTGVAFVAEEGKVATASTDRSIKFWDTQTGKEIVSLSGHDAAVNAIAANLEKGLLVSVSNDKTVRVWSIPYQCNLAILRGHEASVTDVQFSTDGNLVASCGKDGGLIVWQREGSIQPSDTWSLKNRLQLKNVGNIKHIAFHPNGNRLVGVSEDATLTLWDVDTGQEAFSQRIGPESLVSGDVEFSADGNRLVSSYSNQIAVRSVLGNSPHEFQTARAVDWHTRRSNECRSDSNWRGTLFHLDHLVALDSTNWMSLLCRADIYGRLGEWEASEEAYAEGLQRIAAAGELPDDQKLTVARQYFNGAYIQYGGGRIKIGREMFNKAIACLESMHESSPNDLRYTRELAKMLRDFGYFQRNYDSEDAARALARAATLSDVILESEPNSLSDQVDLCNAILNLATVIPKSSRQPLIERAKNVLEPLVKAYPANQTYRRWLAVCLDDYGIWLEENGQRAKAEEQMMRGLDLRTKLVAEYPTDMHARNLLARSYIRLSDPKWTCVSREQAREFWRDHLKTLQVTLRSQAQSGRISGSTADEFSWNLSTCLIHEFRDPERALEWGKIAVKHAPENGSCWNTLGMAYIRNGQWESAKRSFQKSSELRNGGNSFDWYGLAMASWHLGQHDPARELLSKARAWTKENASYNGILLDLEAEAEKLISAAPNPATPLVAENSGVGNY